MSTSSCNASDLALVRAPAIQARQTAIFWAASQRLGALLACILLSPLFALMYVLVRGTSPGPFLFRQERPGKNGKPFAIYKIRTMRPGSEKKTALGTQQTNPSITAIGRILRELKLDELPQLWNIARGEMELVGPRPIPTALHEELARHIEGFEGRYLVKPGLTNVSQVSVMDNELGDQLVADWTLRFEGELHYIRNKSFAYDTILIAMTAAFVIKKLFRQIFHVRPTHDEDVAGIAPDGSVGATRVGDVPICNLDYQGVITKIAGWVGSGTGHYIGVCPVHSIVEARWHADHRKNLVGADLNTADGMPVVWAQMLFGHMGATRVYGPTLMMKTLERAEREGWRIAFYGGHPDRLPILLERLRERLPSLNVVAAISPPFRPLTEEEDDEMVAQLVDARPDIIWVGIGCPKQERWMAEHVDRIPAVMAGVGAAFDFHAGAVRQAPGWIQRLGMEWLFRLCCEPRRLFKRYATTNPTYIAMIGWSLLRSVTARRSYQIRLHDSAATSINHADTDAPAEPVRTAA